MLPGKHGSTGGTNAAAVNVPVKDPAGGATGRFVISAYGVSVAFAAADRRLLAELKEDFAHFGTAETLPCDIQISAHLEPPDLAALKGGHRLVRTSRWDVYKTRSGTRAVHYPEGLVCEYDYGRETGRLSSEDPFLLREIAYLLILSRLGEKLELKGLHRVHAAAAEFGGGGILIAAPMGGGKTTLMVELARDPAFTPLANDTPLIDRFGNIHPFPLRVGLCPDSSSLSRFPEDALRLFKRRHYPEKYLISPGRLSRNTPSVTRCASLFFLKKTAGAPLIEKIGKPRAALELLGSLVIGCGVPQIAEYFLRPELADLSSKARIVTGRAAAALALLRNCGAYRFSLCGEPGLNARTLKLFLSRKHSVNAGPSPR